MRRTKLTPERKERLLRAIGSGMSYERAARYAGIDEKTFYNWKKRGEQAKSGIYFQFLQELNEVETRAEANLLKLIVDAANHGQWRAAAWILSKRWPERWGDEITVKSDSKIVLRVRWDDREGVDDEEEGEAERED